MWTTLIWVRFQLVRFPSVRAQRGNPLVPLRAAHVTQNILDNRQYAGNAFALMRRAERFLIDWLPVAGKIVPGQMAVALAGAVRTLAKDRVGQVDSTPGDGPSAFDARP